MNPWTALGWLLVVLIAAPLAFTLLAGIYTLLAVAWTEARRTRRLRRAHRGKVSCEYVDCDNTATRRGASGFCCERHIGTHLTSRAVGVGSSVSFAQVLEHAKGDK